MKQETIEEKLKADSRNGNLLERNICDICGKFREIREIPIKGFKFVKRRICLKCLSKLIE